MWEAKGYTLAGRAVLAVAWFLHSNVRAKLARGRSSSMLSDSSETAKRPGITVIPARRGFGAEIQGVDLRTIGSDDFSNLHQAWLDHSVLLFRGQNLADDDLI